MKRREQIEKMEKTIRHRRWNEDDKKEKTERRR